MQKYLIKTAIRELIEELIIIQSATHTQEQYKIFNIVIEKAKEYLEIENKHIIDTNNDGKNSIKTAMHIMWDGLMNTHPNQWSELLIHEKESLLEKEKNQIESAFYDGQGSMISDAQRSQAGYYYNQKYNQK